MEQKRRIQSFLELAVSAAALTGLDQWTKFLAVKHLKDQIGRAHV